MEKEEADQEGSYDAATHHRGVSPVTDPPEDGNSQEAEDGEGEVRDEVEEVALDRAAN